jgi:hypothetical protein
MKRLLTTTILATLTWSAAFADARDEVKAAAKNLSEAASYTWTAKTEIEGGQFTPPTITGKVEKGGFALIESEREGNTTTAVRKGDKGVVKTDDGWQTAEELQAAAQGGGGGGRGRGGMLLRNRLPADDLAKIAEKTKELKESEGVISGDLTDEGAKEVASRGGRPGGQAPEPKNAKGSLKVWLKEGKLNKVQVKVSALVTIQGEERDVTRTTTYVFKNIGSTTVTVPEEAKKKLGT